ncbi:MAG: glycosyltransferase family 4 protein [Chloroflexi bacterium]|nr:glycosyltransferase family 4 protein [Chloroflexota bacterium]
MRVLGITPHGLGNYAIQLSNAIYPMTEEVALITSRGLSSELLGTIGKGVKLLLLPASSRFYPANTSLVAQVVRQINSFHPDIIHSQTAHFWYWLALLSRLSHYPVVTTFHDPEPHLGEERLSTRVMDFWARRHSRQVIVHAESLKKLMVGKLAMPEEKVNVVPQGEHYSAFKPWHRENVLEENIVLFFGRIRDYKGLEYLIRAQPLIAREMPGVRVAIAGEGDIGKYRRLMVNPEDFLVYNRFISFEDGAELFQRCKVVVLPYVDASQTAVAQVAYGFGKPVVATNVGGLPEMVNHGETGLVVAPRDPQALAEAVVKLLRDDDLRRRMGQAGQRKLETEYAWDVIAQKTLAVYQKILSKG